VLGKSGASCGLSDQYHRLAAFGGGKASGKNSTSNAVGWLARPHFCCGDRPIFRLVTLSLPLDLCFAVCSPMNSAVVATVFLVEPVRQIFFKSRRILQRMHLTFTSHIGLVCGWRFSFLENQI
jgi:hypothetical protein